MKYCLNIFMALMLIWTPGCALLCGVPPEAQQTAKDNAKLTDAFVMMMDVGTTTREQEQKFLRANRRAWHAQNYALNDILLPHDVEVWFNKYKLGLDTTPAAPVAPVTSESEWKLPPR